MFKHLIIWFCVILFSGCFGTGPGTSPPLPGMVPAGHIRLKATILSIDTSNSAKIDSLDQFDAKIEIDSVEGFGAGAKAVMSGDILKIIINPAAVPVPKDGNQAEDNVLIIPKAGQQFRGDVESLKSETGELTFKISKYIIQQFRRP